jgi:nitrogenase molybdenum-iron protein alpha/beta subunit
VISPTARDAARPAGGPYRPSQPAPAAGGTRGAGDLEDLQTLLCAQPADLLVANSHARDLAEQFALPLVRAGFPIFDKLGEFRRVRQGTAECAIRCLSWQT